MAYMVKVLGLVACETATGYEDAPIVRSAEAAARLLRTLIPNDGREHVWILLLDTQLRVAGAHEVSVGTVNTSLSHGREVFRLAVNDLATSIVIGHNHPSGEVTPSKDDRVLAGRLAMAGEILGIPVVDSIVVTHKSVERWYASILGARGVERETDE